MSDALNGSITPTMANAACNAGGKILKAVDMQQKYGSAVGGTKILQLTNNGKKGKRTNDPIEERLQELEAEKVQLLEAKKFRK